MPTRGRCDPTQPATDSREGRGEQLYAAPERRKGGPSTEVALTGGRPPGRALHDRVPGASQLTVGRQAEKGA